MVETNLWIYTLAKKIVFLWYYNTSSCSPSSRKWKIGEGVKVTNCHSFFIRSNKRKWKRQNWSAGNFQLLEESEKKAVATQKTSGWGSFSGRLVNFQNISSSPCYRPTSDFIIGAFSWAHPWSRKEITLVTFAVFKLKLIIKIW